MEAHNENCQQKCYCITIITLHELTVCKSCRTLSLGWHYSLLPIPMVGPMTSNRLNSFALTSTKLHAILDIQNALATSFHESYMPLEAVC